MNVMKLKQSKLNKSLVAAGVIVVACSTSALASAEEWQDESRDAWVDGKLEASYLLNTELNNFKIDTMVEGGVVTLEGEVSSDINKMLAEEIAMNTDGVTSVNNRLVVDAAHVADHNDNDQERDFGMRVSDMTTTARLKSNFAVNSEIDALDMNITTVNGVVTLDGTVESDSEKMLAEEVAEGYDSVSRVINNLVVSSR